MSNISPEAVARDFYANFGPTYENMATCGRLLHQDVHWEAITSGGDQLLADLERARNAMGAEGLRVELHHVAATGTSS